MKSAFRLDLLSIIAFPVQAQEQLLMNAAEFGKVVYGKNSDASFAIASHGLRKNECSLAATSRPHLLDLKVAAITRW